MFKYQIKYTYKNYKAQHLPKHEYELYRFPHRFVSINYSPIKGVRIKKEVIV